LNQGRATNIHHWDYCKFADGVKHMHGLPVASLARTVTNHGEMYGRSLGLADSDGDAVDTDGLAIIDNYGIIAG